MANSATFSRSSARSSDPVTVPLTKAQRDALPDSAFAVPGKRSFPLIDERHVMMARGQVSRAPGLTEDERTAARAAIQSRAIEFGIDTSAWDTIKSLTVETIDAAAVILPDVGDHPNKMPFRGVLVKLDQASNAAPHGSKGKKVVMSASAAQAGCSSLVGMAVNFTENFDGHDAQRKIGVITAASIEGPDLMIEGFIYASDFPEEAASIKADQDALGFSFEAQQIHVVSLDTDPLVITACVFTGAAILLKDKAAFTTTSLAASATGDIKMTKEELQEIVAAALKPVTDDIASIKVAQTELGTKIEAGKELHAKVVPAADAVRAAATAMQAAGVGVHATRGHVVALNRMADTIESEAMAGSLPQIYNDHGYGMYAGADRSAPDATALTAAVEAATKPLIDQIAAMETKLGGKIAAARAESEAPERKTLSPAITSLLAKAGVDAPDGDKKLDSATVDKIFAGMSVSERIRRKGELASQGLID